MQVTITRFKSKPNVTLGKLKIEGIKHPDIFTLEEPWKDNAPQISCIPKGTYTCRPHNGPRFMKVWEVMNVPGRSAILIHSGNTTRDIEGCILIGLRHGKIGTESGSLEAVLESRKALEILRKVIGEQKFMLTIK